MSGFGHRMYKNYDPRAKVIKKLGEEVFSIVGRGPLIETSIHNRAVGFPTEFFPDLFAIPRMGGYLSHLRESLDDPDTEIMRTVRNCGTVLIFHHWQVPNVTDVGLNPRAVKKVNVIGVGLMGSGIAKALLISNIFVVLNEVNSKYLLKWIKPVEEGKDMEEELKEHAGILRQSELRRKEDEKELKGKYPSIINVKTCKQIEMRWLCLASSSSSETCKMLNNIHSSSMKFPPTDDDRKRCLSNQKLHDSRPSNDYRKDSQQVRNRKALACTILKAVNTSGITRTDFGQT
ncbi:citrate synthase 3, peroxisomal [Artemisia annua]|uniref:Citrate synthase 3, peroxisomal n=1 Tax=Artemisia annua TaxID=35608 RepID=A0A2U1P8V3_ARTAN|nr:citrate synthase 3, peroxisomal [Artemisia annua]